MIGIINHHIVTIGQRNAFVDHSVRSHREGVAVLDQEDDAGALEFASSLQLDGVIPAATGIGIDAVLRTTRVPAISVTAISEGRIAWSGAWGVRGTDDPELVRPATRFQAGSISKTVATFVVLRLVAEGHFGLDDDVNSIAGVELVRAESTEWRPHVTVRQLLAHIAGVNNGGFPGYPHPEFPPGLEVIRGSSRTNTPPIRVLAAPGTAYAYSGGGFVVAQEMAAALLNEPFADIARRVLLEPAEMTRSTYDQLVDGDLAQGHRDSTIALTGGHRYYPEMAAAGLWTTSSDLARFLCAVMAARQGAPDALLPSALAEQMLTPQSPWADYGLGMVLMKQGDVAWFGHGGDTQGFLACVAGSEHGAGFAILTNADVAKDLVNAAAANAQRLLGCVEYPYPLQAGEVMPTSREVATPGGRYAAGTGVVIDVQPRGARLGLTLPHQDEILLDYTGHSTWRATHLNLALVVTGADRLEIRQTMQHGPVPTLTATRRSD